MGKYCTLPQEQCRRHYFLDLLGSASTEMGTVDITKCCDNCSRGIIPYNQVGHVLKKTKVTRKKKRPNIRHITDALCKHLEGQLKQERQCILENSVGFQFLGEEVVCPLQSIQVLCKNATWIQTVDDVASVSGIRPEHAQNFFNVITNVTADAPPLAKRGRLRKKN